MTIIIALVEFFGKPFGKFVGYILLILFVAATLFGLYKNWESNIKARALAEYNQTQLKKAVEEQARMNASLLAIMKLQNEAVQKLDQRRQETNALGNGIDLFLHSDTAKKADRPASDILRETFKRLGAPE